MIPPTTLHLSAPETSVLFRTRLIGESPAALFMCEGQTLEKVQTQFSGHPMEVIDLKKYTECGPLYIQQGLWLVKVLQVFISLLLHVSSSKQTVNDKK